MEKTGRRYLTLITAIAIGASALTFVFVGLPRLAADPGGGKNVIMARNVAAHGVLSDAVAPPYFPSARRAPLYSFFLAAFFSAGVPLAAVLFVQFALSVIIPLLTFAIGREFFSARVSLIAGVLMAVHPLQLAMPSTFDDAWLFEIFWLAGFLYFIRALKSNLPLRLMAIAGLWFGISGLVRPLTMALWPVFLIVLLWNHRRRAAPAIAAFVIILATLWTPWFYRNWRTFHAFFITTQGSYIMVWDSYAFYLSDTLGISHGEAKHRIRLAIEERTGRSLPYEGGDAIDDPFLNEPALAALTTRYVYSEIIRDPLRYAVSHLRHSIPFWTGSSLREFLASTPWYPPSLVATRPNFTREITAGNWRVVREEFSRLGPAVALYGIDFLIFFLALYGLALVGLVAWVRSSERSVRALAAALLVLFVAAPVITSGVYIGPRYRFPLEPFFLLLACSGAVVLRKAGSRFLLQCIPPRLRFRAVDLKQRLVRGFSPRTTFSQYGEDRVLAELFMNHAEGWYVDVGAHHPERYSNTHLLSARGWRGINIDPNEESIALFRARRPRDINLVSGVSEIPGEREYYTFSDPAVNTFDSVQAAHWQGKSWIAFLGMRRVAVRTLSEILATHLPAGRTIDLLNVDAEGWDLSVLQSNDWDRYRSDVVVAESTQFRASAPTEDALYVFLTAQSYELVAQCGPSLIFRSLTHRNAP